jgi:hypothetical protein
MRAKDPTLNAIVSLRYVGNIRNIPLSVRHDPIQPNHPKLQPNQAHCLIEGFYIGKSKTDRRKFAKQRMALVDISHWEIRF